MLAINALHYKRVQPYDTRFFSIYSYIYTAEDLEFLDTTKLLYTYTNSYCGDHACTNAIL